MRNPCEPHNVWPPLILRRSRNIDVSCFIVFQRAYFFACSGWAYSILADFDAADDPVLDRIVLHLVPWAASGAAVYASARESAKRNRRRWCLISVEGQMCLSKASRTINLSFGRASNALTSTASTCHRNRQAKDRP